MRSGELDRQVTIERKAVEGEPGYIPPDTSYGTEVTSWVPLAYVPGSPPVAERFWAQLQDALPSRSEAVTQGLTLARNQTRMRMRWRDDITSDMRVRVHNDAGDDEIYQIVGGPAAIDGRKQMLELVLEKYSS